MKHPWMGLALGLGLAACGSGPAPFGTTVDDDADTNAGSRYLIDNNSALTLNNIAYDPGSDTLTINNIPFDDPNNAYERITTEKFSNGFDAYQSAPAAGSNELQYFAVFRRSDSGNSQVAAAGTDEYIGFGFGGAGAQRLGAAPNLPASGIYSYNGEYAAVRTTLANPNNVIQYVTGDVRLNADFDDFDEVGAVGGTITNRLLYDTTGAPIGTLDGFISLANATIDRTNGTINSSTAVEVINGQQNSGNWSGVFAGPGGNEIAGILFVEGNGVREAGGIVTVCTGANCP
ncbi:MAG: hypothetical protein WA790_01270 [Sulfitobacter sp.]